MSALYTSAVLSAPQSVTFSRLPLPEIGPTQIRVHLEGCGVGSSNLPVWEGRPWFTYPFPAGAPGHEGWGRVDAIGEAVQGIKPGDRVALLSQHAFAEYDCAEADQAVKLPGALAEQPFPGEALGCAVNVFRRAAIRPGETVAIVGIGFLGAVLTHLSAEAGAHTIAISRRPFALEIARRMGADELLSITKCHDVIGAVREMTSGRGCECVIEATGFQQPLDLAAELTAERGRLIIAGYHQDGPRQVNMQLWNWRGLDVINAHERDSRRHVDGMRDAVALVSEGRLNPEPLYTDRLSLEELPAALDEMRTRPERFLKALVTYA